MALYEAGPEEVWSDSNDRADFHLVRTFIRASLASGSRILDVGCHAGHLLAPLVGDHETFGVEPNTLAAARAEARGIGILGGSIDELVPEEGQFDLVVACDVIEHVLDPVAFFAAARALLAPSGRILVTTGDRSAGLWRFAGAAFWYCSFPEHISFMSKESADALVARAGLELEQADRFNYRSHGWSARLARLCAALLYARAPRAYRLLRRLGGGGSEIPVPGCGATDDHLMIVARIPPRDERRGAS